MDRNIYCSYYCITQFYGNFKLHLETIFLDDCEYKYKHAVNFVFCNIKCFAPYLKTSIGNGIYKLD